MSEIFYGLWIPRNEDYQNLIQKGIWINKLSNKQVALEQMKNFRVGDLVFLYQRSEDIKIKKSPFVEYLPKNYPYLNNKIFHVRALSIGKIKNIDLEHFLLKVDWSKSYKITNWYIYFRQDGAWIFDDRIDKKKKQELYDIVFNHKEQDYKWWAENYIKRNFKENDNFQNSISSDGISIKNIILYGPPGVGKTHNINKLIRLIEDGKSQKEIFETIKNNEFSQDIDILDIKDRVKFITFHQSFGYEDFIEGFRPNEEGNIELIDGIFKRLCLVAQKNLDNSKKDISFDIDGLLNDFIQEVENKDKYLIDDNLTIEVKKKGDGEFQSFLLGGRVKNQSLTKNIILRDFENYLNGKIKQYQDIKPTNESQKSYHGNALYYFKLFEAMKSFMEKWGLNYKTKKEELKNYYLVIDEINRGNISKIFGELITLIEEDKRDNLEVILPYSKESFKVPSNLYIIGTMNSSDKSIALIDIALRRRFTFLKMKPNINLVPLEAKELFENLNNYISNNLGEDYKIGHSYFMGDIDLDFILEYKIKPLLEEYFYGDENRLNEALEIIKKS
jgi:5-methylcytosine-specific restriction protein B